MSGACAIWRGRAFRTEHRMSQESELTTTNRPENHSMDALMNDALQEIFLFLEPADVYNASHVCQQWQRAVIGDGNELSEVNILWYRMLLRDQHLSEETMCKYIQDSRRLSQLNKGQLQRMRRSKRHKKKRDQSSKSFQHQFRENESVRYWERIYWYHLEKIDRCADLNQKLRDLHKAVCYLYPCWIPTWYRITPELCTWKRDRTGSARCNLQFEETVEEGVVKHTIHCTKCKVAISTTDLKVSKKKYSDCYGPHRAKFYPLKLHPISVFNYDTLEGEIIQQFVRT